MWPFTRKRNGREGRPRRDWPWTLHVGEELWPNFDTWEMVEPELRELNLEDPDSFLILEQRDPRDAGRYWFIQSAMNPGGDNAGGYSVECGWSTAQGPVLYDLQVRTVEEVIPWFRSAFQEGAVDLSRFTDVSDDLPANQKK